MSLRDQEEDLVLDAGSNRKPVQNVGHAGCNMGEPGEMSNEPGTRIQNRLERRNVYLGKPSKQRIAVVTGTTDESRDHGCKHSGGNRSSNGSQTPQMVETVQT